MLNAESETVHDLDSLLRALIDVECEAATDVTAHAADLELRRIGICAELTAVADEALHASVATARARGLSWHLIGQDLGISRQAAFQRFGHPVDPQGGIGIKTHSMNALIPRAEEIYGHLANGEFRPVGTQMTFVVQRILNEKKVMGIWSHVVADVGRLESLGTSFLRPNGTNAVVETPLSFEAGEFVGRIAYNKRGKIVGMLILLPASVADAPF